MSSPKYYTGVGAREVPDSIFNEMKMIAKAMARNLYVVRSGAAVGSDTAFEVGAGANTEIYLPWDGFNGHTSACGAHLNAKSLYNYDKAMYIASMHHPAWESLKQGVKALHARNAYQVLGFGLDNPSQVLICYAQPIGIKKVKGGTATAVSIAHDYGVPVYNLWHPKDLTEIKRIVGIYD